jgi:hypothetical protein
MKAGAKRTSLVALPLGSAIFVLTLLLAVAALASSVTAGASSWRIETVDNAGNVGQYTSIAVDENGWPHISYYDYTNSKLKYAYWNGSTWNIENVADTLVYYSGSTSLALDSQGRSHISYYDAAYGDLKHAQWTESEWMVETIDNENDVGKYSSLALDNNDRPHVSYSAHGDLKYARWTGSEWGVETIDNENYAGGHISIALDGNDRPHVSYCNLFRHLMYAKRSENEWETKTVDDLAYYFTSIALDSNDRPHIGYIGDFYEPIHVNLKYAKWTGDEWIIETIDNETSYYLHPSIALDSGNRPHISYLAKASLGYYHLKHAQSTRSGWRIETIDNAVFFGIPSEAFDFGGASIALDSSDRLHISYCSYGATGGNLKYAAVETVQGTEAFIWLVVVAAIGVGIGALIKLRFSRGGSK